MKNLFLKIFFLEKLCFGAVVQLARMSALQAEGQRFDSAQLHILKRFLINLTMLSIKAFIF